MDFLLKEMLKRFRPAMSKALLSKRPMKLAESFVTWKRYKSRVAETLV